MLLSKDDSGWWRYEFFVVVCLIDSGRNERGEEGTFPSNFVDDGDEGEGGESQVVEINAVYRALYDYEAEDETELTIREGDLLQVQTETDGWYFGANVNGGRSGTFPSNYCQLASE